MKRFTRYQQQLHRRLRQRLDHSRLRAETRLLGREIQRAARWGAKMPSLQDIKLVKILNLEGNVLGGEDYYWFFFLILLGFLRQVIF